MLNDKTEKNSVTAAGIDDWKDTKRVGIQNLQILKIPLLVLKE